jgi:hypothetical protein
MFGFCPLRSVKRESDRPAQTTPGKISRKQGSEQAKKQCKKRIRKEYEKSKEKDIKSVMTLIRQ